MAVAMALTMTGSACGGADEPRAERDVPLSFEISGRGDVLAPNAGNEGYDVEHYDWDLAVDPRTGELRGRARLRALATAELDVVVLDFDGPEVDEVAVKGRSVTFTRRDAKLAVASPVRKGDHFDVQVVYAGVPEPVRASGIPGPLGWNRRTDAVFTTAVLPGNTASWVPLNDTPLDPATYELAITVPDGYTATASGTPAGTEDGDGTTTTTFRIDVPTTEVTVAIGRYEIHQLGGSRPAASVALPPGASPEAFSAVPSMLDLLVKRLGPLPIDAVGFTQVQAGFDGDSTLGRINLGRTTQSVQVHELAHQWMGGIVSTASSTDVWLREGLPTYAELLWVEQEQGRAEADAVAASWRDAVGSTSRAPLDVRSGGDRIDAATYERGALVFHELRQRLGDETFFAVLQRFFEDFTGRAATTDDFLATASRVSGVDLGQFFDSWLRNEAVPEPQS